MSPPSAPTAMLTKDIISKYVPWSFTFSFVGFKSNLFTKVAQRIDVDLLSSRIGLLKPLNSEMINLAEFRKPVLEVKPKT